MKKKMTLPSSDTIGTGGQIHAMKARRFSVRHLLPMLAALVLQLPAQAQNSPNGLQVTVPNGFANLTAYDMQVASTAGNIRFTRVWNGQEWKFNPQWESLSQSWKNLTGSQTADTTGSTLTSVSSSSSGGGSSGCWVWVDEDWTPSTGTAVIGGVPQAEPLLPERSTPFNRVMGEVGGDYPAPQRVSVDYASLCAGTSFGNSALRDAEGIRRINELYLGDGGRYAFNNRSILEKRAVRQLPTAEASQYYAQLATGKIALAPVTNDKGFRWLDKGGDWIDYNTQGQVVAWGDRNDNTVWLVRDTDGIVRGAVDAHGRVLYSLHYSGKLLTEVRDYPVSGAQQDLPARGVQYRYDDKNRLIEVTDVRGNLIKYDYDDQHRIVKITDQEGRVEQIAYSGEMVKQHIAPDGGVTDYAFEYDDVNKQFISKITGPETAAGRRIGDFTHNRVGKLVRKIVNGRTETEVSYDTGARAEKHINARGFATRTVRNEFDQVVETIHPDGASQKRSYAALHLQVTEEIDETGIKTQYQYDSKGNLTRKTEAAGTADERITDYARNSLGQTIGITRRGRTEANGIVTPDAVWQIEYDALGQIAKTIDPEGHVRQYAYDRAGNLARFTDPRGHLTRYEVDAKGHLTKTIDALGRERSYQYDKVGNLTSAIDARGKTTQAAYDAMNRQLQTVNPVGGITKLQYNAQGLPVAATDADSRSVEREYDNFLRLTRQIDALGNATQFGYQIPDGSAAGQLGSQFLPTETIYPTFTQQTRFNERERPTSQILKNGTSQGLQTTTDSAIYDKRGLLISETDADGHTRTHVYNALGLRTEITDALQGKTRFLYDVRGNLLQVSDPKGHIYRFEYDRNNRVRKEILPLGQTNRYSYDPAGNLAEKSDARGNKFVYTFDAANRLTQIKQYQADGTLLRTTTHTWDDNDNRTGWSDTDHTRPAGQQIASGSATYDDANRKTGETVNYPNPQGGSYTLGYGQGHSPGGKTTGLTWPDGTQIAYAYSAHGELETVTIPDEGTISVNQFKWIAPAKITLPGGSTQNKTHDGLLKLESLHVKTPGQQSVLALSHGYGKLQELKTRTRTDTVAGTSSNRSDSYLYDAETRLTQATTDTGGFFGTDTETFTLDAVGNRTAHSEISGAWIYDANNRLTKRGDGACGSAGTTCYDHDDTGNLIKTTEGAQVTHYGYDTLNRLIEVRRGTDQLLARYGYDPQNRRLWKEQYRDRDGNPLTQVIRTYYLYGDEGLLAEAAQAITLDADGSVSSSQAPSIKTQYGPRPGSPFTTGMLFVKTINSNGQAMFAYYHHDHLDTPIQATDKTGNVVWAAQYDAFGKAQIVTPAATVDKPVITSALRLPGQIEDPETGWHYNLNRYYDPTTGRYATSDPIGLEGGMNTYVYVGGNPLSYRDPTGLEPPSTSNTFPGNRNKGNSLYPKRDPCECEEDGGPRWPDYWTGSVPIAGLLGVSITIDRAGNVYGGVGVGVGLRGGFGGAAGWTGDHCKPTSDQLKDFLSGWGANAGAGPGVTWASPFSEGSEDPNRLGMNVQTPGVSLGYNWHLTNL